MVNKSDSVLIVGGGTWGCSIALELARNGYSDVTVLDGEEAPSSIAAGNDLNKIMEEGSQSEDDTDAAYAWNRLHNLCTTAWLNDPIYKPHYHRTGYVMAASSDAAYEALLKDIRGHEDEYHEVASAEQFQKTMPEGVLTGDFAGWRGFAKSSGAGWVFARGAIVSAKQEAERLGARFISGQKGLVTKFLFSSETEHDRNALQGVQSADGTIYHAHTTILANGANADTLMDLKYQLRPTAWTLAHIKMTPTEAELYKNLPVLFNIEKGFFMEPSAETHELKICDEHPGYINPVYGGTSSDGEKVIVGSKPFARHQIPLESEDRMRAFLKETMPHLAARPFSFARICWDADTVDRMPLLDWHGSHTTESGRLLLAIGGSGHCFKTMPAMGQVMLEYLEGKVDDRTRRAFRWRPETAKDRNWWDVQNRWGAQGEVMDITKVKGWTEMATG
ncbi:fructosyl-amino acid oxidase [Xylaria bambusicola]|uniref:fructosyl-amino acid oxidase n=1 Tax=Xylaria bambusicola TaxID=326684 RepID=UPI002008A777|nr:fructosyl-amino acid oxidase [Xylaria bambusicola]KAI0528165.1 fructosyl-amino acid oxidase [Xylaria bambusicola]